MFFLDCELEYPTRTRWNVALPFNCDNLLLPALLLRGHLSHLYFNHAKSLIDHQLGQIS